MDIKEKWVNDKRAKLKGEIVALEKSLQQLQREMQQKSVMIIQKRGELQAIEDVWQQIKRKPEPPKKKEEKETK